MLIENTNSNIASADAGVSPEMYLSQRIQRGMQRKDNQEVVYEFTKDPGYLHQYYILRSQVIGRTWGWSLPAEADDYDAASHILIARKGNQVIGGGRIVVRSPRLNRPLLLESDDFSLIDALPDLKLANMKYCEFSRFVLLEEYQQSLVSLEMFYRIYKKYKALGISYGFAGVATASTRIYRRLSSSLGLHYRILSDVELPDRPHYEGLPMTLVMFDDRGVAEHADQRYEAISRISEVV